MAKKSVKKPELKVKQISHPNSRKAQQLSKKTTKLIKRNKSKIQHQMKLNTIGEKMLFVQENVDEIKSSVCTPEQIAEIIEKYLSRFDEELEQIALKHSIGKRGRQHASREDALNMIKSQEKLEYETCGIEIPDLLNATQVSMLKDWNGEIRFIQNFKLRRFSKQFLSSQLDKTEKSKSNPELEASNEKSLSTCMEMDSVE
ncbi:translation machinery-associated protein 16 homolog [Nilaparvata lugens]|uniref:translation machinery-associated protein 16 homolog n=1 Tax=Nilaparvata lugens TaxID=108931 RepID=UPI00193E9008|nr:translation machinery-associated protein 16 homolog [Nilaparvata lugens]